MKGPMFIGFFLLFPLLLSSFPSPFLFFFSGGTPKRWVRSNMLREEQAGCTVSIISNSTTLSLFCLLCTSLLLFSFFFSLLFPLSFSVLRRHGVRTKAGHGHVVGELQAHARLDMHGVIFLQSRRLLCGYFLLFSPLLSLPLFPPFLFYPPTAVDIDSRLYQQGGSCRFASGAILVFFPPFFLLPLLFFSPFFSSSPLPYPCDKW